MKNARYLFVFLTLTTIACNMNFAIANNSGSGNANANADGFNSDTEIGSIHNEYEMESAADARLAMAQYLLCVAFSIVCLTIGLAVSGGNRASKYY